MTKDDLPPLPAIFYERFAPSVGLNVCDEARAYALAAIAAHDAKQKKLKIVGYLVDRAMAEPKFMQTLPRRENYLAATPLYAYIEREGA